MGSTTVKHRNIHIRDGGYSLIELMVAITIGLIILAAVSALFVGSKKGYTTQDRLARLQENGRFAMQFLIKDMRLAGYYGCVSDISESSISNSLNGDTSFAYNASSPIEGFNGTASRWYPSNVTTTPAGKRSDDSDMVMIRMADVSLAVNLSTEMPNESSELTVASVSGFNEGDIIMISDCSSADIIQITQVQTASSKLQHAPGGDDTTQNPPWPGNKTGQAGKLSKTYGTSSKVMRFISRQYYIGTGASGNPALFRSDNSGSGVELVDGIERIRILYGKDTDSDRKPNIYLKAGDTGLQSATDWSSVVSMRIGILTRTTTQQDTDTDSNSYDVDGDGTNDFTAPGDRNKRRIFTATVHLRNL